MSEPKTCVVTGGTNGIGLVIARELAKKGMRTVIVGRDQKRGQAAVDDVKRYAGHDRVELALCDFSKLADIRALGKDLNARLDRLHVLVNNAGAVFASRQVTVDGFEMTFAVNHLGYFLLTNLLLDLLKKSAPARIVSTASAVHTGGRIDFDDLQANKRYSSFGAYSNSKLANVLFTRELARRLAGTGVVANCVHPGAIASGFGRNNGGIVALAIRIGQVFMKSPEEGARTSIHVATSEALAGVTGKYFAKSKEVKPSDRALDDDVARRLWTVSEELSGIAKAASSASAA